MRETSSSNTSSIFALTGAWGSGKSWLLTPLMRELAAKSTDDKSASDTVIEFNPWLFSDERALFLGFSSMLLGARKGRRKARESLIAGLRLLGSTLSVGGPVAFNFEGIGNAVADRLSPVASPAKLRKAIADELELGGSRVFVVMDDLDRLTPDELITLFKLIRLLGDIPGLQYVLAYDQETVLHLLDQTSIAQGSTFRAERYLEKIVERRFSVPPLTENQVQALAIDPMVEFAQRFDNDPKDQQAALIEFRLRPFIYQHIRTPRAAERFIDAVRRLNPDLVHEVRMEHWCVAALLRTFFPRVWELIVAERDLLTGVRRSLFASEEVLKARAAHIHERLRKLLASAPDAAELIELIKLLFPAFDTLSKGRSLQEADLRRAAQERGIGHPEFVDRYLWDDLPPGAISEGNVRRLLGELPREDAMGALADLVGESGSVALEAISRNAAVAEPVAMVAFLEKVHKQRSPQPGEVDAGVRRGVIERQAAVYLARQDASVLREVLNPGVDSTINRPLLRGALTSDHLSYLPPGHLKSWVEEARAALRAELEQSLPEAPSPALDQWDTRERVVDLLRLSLEGARALIEQVYEGRRWRADDIASIYATTYEGSDGPIVAGVAMDQLRRDLGAELVARLAADDNLAPFPDDWVGAGPGRDIALPLNVENVRAITAYCLKVFGTHADDE
jgi:hypothetical protein